MTAGASVIRAFYQAISDAESIPIMIQDAPAAGTPLSAEFLALLAREVEHVGYFKIETAGAAGKLRELIRLGGDTIQGPWDGEEAITLLPDLEAGATGAMTGGGFPDGIRPILDATATVVEMKPLRATSAGCHSSTWRTASAAWCATHGSTHHNWVFTKP